MDRRKFITGALAGMSSKAAIGSTGPVHPKINVMLVGFCFSGSFAWDLKAASDKWLDTERFNLSALVVASESLPIQLFGRLGRVPEAVFRGYGNLDWVRDELCGIDVAVLIGDTRNAAFSQALETLMRRVRQEVPMMIFVTVDQWTLTESELMPIRVRDAGDLLRFAGGLVDLSFSLSERVGVERLGRAVSSLRKRCKGGEVPLNDETDQAFRFFSRVRFDCLALPIVRLFGRHDYQDLKPSTILS